MEKSLFKCLIKQNIKESNEHNQKLISKQKYNKASKPNNQKFELLLNQNKIKAMPKYNNNNQSSQYDNESNKLYNYTYLQQLLKNKKNINFNREYIKELQKLSQNQINRNSNPCHINNKNSINSQQLNITLPYFFTNHSNQIKTQKCPFHHHYCCQNYNKVLNKNQNLYYRNSSKLPFVSNINTKTKQLFRLNTENSRNNYIQKNNITKKKDKVISFNSQQYTNVNENQKNINQIRKNQKQLNSMKNDSKMISNNKSSKRKQNEVNKELESQIRLINKSNRKIALRQIKNQKNQQKKRIKQKNQKIKEIQIKQQPMEINQQKSQVSSQESQINQQEKTKVQKIFVLLTNEAHIFSQNLQDLEREKAIQQIIKSKLNAFKYLVTKLKQKRYSFVKLLNSDQITYNQCKIVTLKKQNLENIYDQIYKKLIQQNQKLLDIEKKQQKENQSNAITEGDNLNSQVEEKLKFHKLLNNKIDFMENNLSFIDQQRQKHFSLQLQKGKQQRSSVYSKRSSVKSQSSRKSSKNFSKQSSQKLSAVKLMDKHKALTIIKKKIQGKRDTSQNSSQQSSNRIIQEDLQKSSQSEQKSIKQIKSMRNLWYKPKKSRINIRSLTNFNKKKIKQVTNQVTDFLLCHINDPKSKYIKRHQVDSQISNSSIQYSSQKSQAISVSGSQLQQGKTQRSIKYYISKQLKKVVICRKVSRHLRQRALGKLIIKPQDSFFQIKKKLRNINNWAHKQYHESQKTMNGKLNKNINQDSNNELIEQTSKNSMLQKLMSYITIYQKYCYLGVKDQQQLLIFLQNERLKKQNIENQKKELFKKDTSYSNQKQLQQLKKDILNKREQKMNFMKLAQAEYNQLQVGCNFKIYSFFTKIKRKDRDSLQIKRLSQKQTRQLSQIGLQTQFIIQDQQIDSQGKQNIDYSKKNMIFKKLQLRNSLKRFNNLRFKTEGNQTILNKKFSQKQIKQIFRHAISQHPKYMSTFMNQTRNIDHSKIIVSQRFPKLLNSKKDFGFTDNSILNLNSISNDTKLTISESKIQKSNFQFFKNTYKMKRVNQTVL